MQTKIALDQIRTQLSGLADLYYRLLLVVGPSGSGKTAVLRALSQAEDWPMVNLGLELSRRLLDLTERQRALQVPRLLEEMAETYSTDVILLDNTEILFAPVLKQDPLRLLQGMSRVRTVVATWLGTAVGGYLTYAVPEHPEFRRYSSKDVMIVPLGEGDQGEQVQR